MKRAFLPSFDILTAIIDSPSTLLDVTTLYSSGSQWRNGRRRQTVSVILILDLGFFADDAISFGEKRWPSKS